MNQDLLVFATNARSLWVPDELGSHRYICNCLWTARGNTARDGGWDGYYNLKAFVRREINDMPTVEHLMGVGNLFLSEISDEQHAAIARRRWEIWEKMIQQIKEGALT